MTPTEEICSDKQGTVMLFINKYISCTDLSIKKHRWECNKDHIQSFCPETCGLCETNTPSKSPSESKSTSTQSYDSTILIFCNDIITCHIFIHFLAFDSPINVAYRRDL